MSAPVSASGAGVNGLPASVVVTGAASQVGFFLLPRLTAAGIRVVAVSRRPEALALASFGRGWHGRGSASWVQADLERPSAGGWSGDCEAWIHLGPLRLVPPLLVDAPASLRRIVAFGSTSRFTKARSAHPREQRIVADLEAGEAGLARSCASAGIGWTLVRPTLIYGAGLDRNVMVIATAIRRFGLFPLVGGGAGLRQPVHADDLAAARRRRHRRGHEHAGGDAGLLMAHRRHLHLLVDTAAVGVAHLEVQHLAGDKARDLEGSRRCLG
jgi:nucleoside-diphosphate-sugar epimerase